MVESRGGQERSQAMVVGACYVDKSQRSSNPTFTFNGEYQRLARLSSDESVLKEELDEKGWSADVLRWNAETVKVLDSDFKWLSDRQTRFQILQGLCNKVRQLRVVPATRCDSRSIDQYVDMYKIEEQKRSIQEEGRETSGC